MSFHVGQKVVCIDAAPLTCDSGWIPADGPDLHEGEVYTVRGVFCYPNSDVPVLRLAGMHCSIGWCGIETGYMARRFRPLVERKTDIGMAILRKAADDAAKTRELVKGD